MSERRRDARRPAQGEVLLFVAEPLACRIPARLLDTSAGGFRAAHHYAALAAGQEIRYRCDERQGRARVIWTRVMPSRVESGFLLIPSP